MIADEITRIPQTMKERGLPDNAYFEVEFTDGSKRSEHDTSWASMSSKVIVGYFGSKKSVTVCQFPVKRLYIRLGELEAIIDVPEGGQAYQAIRAETLFLPENKRQYRVIGRSAGYVLDGEVREEMFLDSVQN